MIRAAEEAAGARASAVCAFFFFSLISPTNLPYFFFASPPGPFCHRALLTAAAKSVPLKRGYIDFAAKPDW